MASYIFIIWTLWPPNGGKTGRVVIIVIVTVMITTLTVSPPSVEQRSEPQSVAQTRTKCDISKFGLWALRRCSNSLTRFKWLVSPFAGCRDPLKVTGHTKTPPRCGIKSLSVFNRAKREGDKERPPYSNSNCSQLIIDACASWDWANFALGGKLQCDCTAAVATKVRRQIKDERK